MITPQQLRDVLNETSFVNAYSTLIKEHVSDKVGSILGKEESIFSTEEKPKFYQHSSLSSDKETLKLIKKALKGDPEKRENIIIGACTYFESERDIGKKRFAVNAVARCAVLKKRWFSQTMEPRLEVLVSSPDKKFEPAALSLPRKMGTNLIDVEYIVNMPVRAYVGPDLDSIRA